MFWQTGLFETEKENKYIVITLGICFCPPPSLLLPSQPPNPVVVGYGRPLLASVPKVESAVSFSEQERSHTMEVHSSLS